MYEAQITDTRAALLSRAQGYLAAEPSFARFLRAVVEATDPDDFAGRDAGELEQIFRAGYGRLGKRELAPYGIYMLPPEAAGRPDTIEIFSADMPFIVDSVLGAVRALGGVVRLMSHPILTFDPATYRVLERPAPGSRLESYLHLEIEPLGDAGTREALRQEIDLTLADVGHAVADHQRMLSRIRKAIGDWHAIPPKAPPPAVAEAMHFLTWLGEGNFIFLGAREYHLEPDAEGRSQLVPQRDTGLGILADPRLLFLRAGPDFVETTEQHRAFLTEAAPILVTKANIRARVHRRSHMDYVGIKLFDQNGDVSGELRLIGLFTSASLRAPNTDVPLIRRKISEVIRRAAHPPQSHAEKALTVVLETWPREELFQIDEKLLQGFAEAVANLGDRPRIRVLARPDRFDNFVSVLVYVPRDRYDSEARQRIGAYLAQVFDGRVSAFSPFFPESELVRVHFIIGRNGGPTPQPPQAELEAAVTELTLSFSDRLRATGADRSVLPWLEAFPAAYQSRHGAGEALADIAVVGDLIDERSLAVRLLPRPDGPGLASLRVYHLSNPIPLSDRVPILENFGFRAVDEQTYTLTPRGRPEVYLHDMVLRPDGAPDLTDRDAAHRIENAILAVWVGEAENDGLNRLTVTAGLGWYDVEVLRALLRYLFQLGVPYSRDYLVAVLARHPDIAVALLTLFHAVHDPHYAGLRDRAAGAARESIATAIEATTSLDEDRILRRLVSLNDAILRTNAYQRDAEGNRRPALAIKFECHKVDGMPEPRPLREIFVYSPRVEGLHLRFGPIARGGLRWSDRPEDFRTEVLGLVKAQQVKNAIIVPVGAKGAFVPRRLVAGGDREFAQREGTIAYKIFVSTLLDVTDNLEGDAIVPPPDVVRRDGDDSYLVVAADKGTASFSDIANAIAVDRDFWLGDAFASGGATGYDHKKMGITARGAWESVKRHFREMDRDIDKAVFSAVGVGDMSGDVFGNGMLLSPQLKLVAAFDHRDIFIDPDPDLGKALAERRRLFELPRSSWQDYDKTLLSKGGGVFSRTLKTIALAPEARHAIGLRPASDALAPADLIRAILSADVDLLWFGGIGTYVRATAETDGAAGDKANDPVRVTGAMLRARIVAEGANLAVTQRGRVEYALKGGRINSDAIDNSAGVNSSDLEVNIKIALNGLLRSGELTQVVRNDFLATMTDEVAALCLRNNYLQTLAISVEEHRGAAAFPEHLQLLKSLESSGALSRAVEALPGDAVLAERVAAGRGFTRPELGTLLAYGKNGVQAALLDSTVPDDLYLGRELDRYFPQTLCDTFHGTITGHPLRRQVIATVLANAMLNRGGPAFVSELTAATSAGPGEVAAAYAAARDAYDTTGLNRDLDALDGVLSGRTQLALYAEVQALLRRQTLWFLRNGSFERGLGPLVERHLRGVEALRPALAGLMPPGLQRLVAARAAVLGKAGVPAEMARRFAELPVLGLASDTVLVADRAHVIVEDAATALLGLIGVFGLGAVMDEARTLVPADRYDRMALDRALANLMRALRDLSADILINGTGPVADRVTRWQAEGGEAVARVAAATAGLAEGALTVSRLSVVAGLMGDLTRSA